MYHQEIGEAYLHEFVECLNESCPIFEEEQELDILVSYSISSASGKWVCVGCLKEYEWTGDTPDFDDPRDEYGYDYDPEEAYGRDY